MINQGQSLSKKESFSNTLQTFGIENQEQPDIEFSYLDLIYRMWTSPK